MAGDFKVVYAKRDALFEASAKKVQTQQAHSQALFKKVQSKLSNQVLAGLFLTIWAVCNGKSVV